MNINSSISFHPAIEDLKTRIRNSRLVLLRLLEDWHYQQNDLKDKLSSRYQSLFGELETELNNKTLVSSELERRLELLAIRIQRGQKINPETLGFVNRIVDKEFEKYNKNGSAQSKKSASENAHKGKDAPPSPELTSVYRSLVKILHPDKSGGSQLFQRYWHSVQDAYKKGNLQRLKLFSRSLVNIEDREYPDTYSEEIALNNELKDLEINIEAERRRIENLKKQAPFIYADMLDDQAWVEKHRSELKNNIARVEREIAYYKKTLVDMIGKDTTESTTEDIEKEFHETFMYEAYQRRG